MASPWSGNALVPATRPRAVASLVGSSSLCCRRFRVECSRCRPSACCPNPSPRCCTNRGLRHDEETTVWLYVLIKLRRSHDWLLSSLVLRFFLVHFTLLRYYADKRIVNIIEVYIERNNLQLELIQYHKKMWLYSCLLLRRDEFNAISSTNIAYQKVSNTNHFGSVSDSIGWLAAMCECMASVLKLHKNGCCWVLPKTHLYYYSSPVCTNLSSQICPFLAARPQFDSDHHQNRRLCSHSYSHESVIFFVFLGFIFFKCMLLSSCSHWKQSTAGQFKIKIVDSRCAQWPQLLGCGGGPHYI